MLYGILAKKQHGKDTIADYLVSNYGYTKTSFAEPLKQSLKVLFGFTDEQLYGGLKEVPDSFWGVTPRETMQFVGTEVFRDQIQRLIPSVRDEFWVHHFKNWYMKNRVENVVVADVRFQNEVDAIHAMGGKVIKVVRPCLDGMPEHASEDIDRITNFDFLVMNDKCIEELYSNVEQVI